MRKRSVFWMSAMKSATLSAIVTAAIALALPWSQPVSASSAPQRCTAVDGSAIYTDRACPAFGAKALPLPGELLGRIVAAVAEPGEKVIAAGESISLSRES